MSISVVTVVLNAADDLPLTIESVRQQDYNDVEFIVVDGGSYDSTADVLSRYADSIDKVVRVEDAGIYYAMNIALDHCSNEYVLFLNATDTLFAATTLSRLIACKRPDADVFFGNHVYVQGRRGRLERSLDYGQTVRALLDGKIDATWLSRIPGHQATFVRRDLLRRLRFDTDIEICADHDVLMRAFEAGASFQYIDETVSHYVGGGFSAQRSARLRLEWCALYREFSTDPTAVDRFFLGEDASPFGTQNAMTGVWLSGDYPVEGPRHEMGIVKPVSWCRPDGVSLRAPRHGTSHGLLIEGFNPFDEQQVTLICGENEIATFTLAKGWYKRNVAFAMPVAPSAAIELVASRVDEIAPGDRRIVGLAVASFAFQVSSTRQPLKPGARLAFSQENAQSTERLLGDGWSVQESSHIWSVGERAGLRLPLSPLVKTLVLRCKGNPEIDDDEERGAEISVDGEPAGVHLLARDATDITLAVPKPTEEGVAHIEIKPLLRRRLANDERLLGVCLVAVECR